MVNPNHPVVIVLGAGGHARVLIEMLTLTGRKIIGVITPELEPGSFFCNVQVLGGDEILENYSPEEVELVNGVGIKPCDTGRIELAERKRQQGFHFASVVHPSAVISDDVKLFEGVQIMAGAIIQPGVRIKSDCIINTGARIDHDCVIEESSHVAPGSILCGGVSIGRNSYIGAGTVIIQNIRLGADVLVAAGSCVFHDLGKNEKLVQLRK